MTIFEDSVITDDSEKESLLGRMVKITGYAGLPARKTCDFLHSRLIEYPTTWVKRSCQIPRDLADKYVAENGEWVHGYKQERGKHNDLGMAFAQWVKDEFAAIVLLDDCPDVVMYDDKDRKAGGVGDIGKCSVTAIGDALTRLYCPLDYWFSVLDYNEIIFVLFHYDRIKLRDLYIGSMCNGGDLMEYIKQRNKWHLLAEAFPTLQHPYVTQSRLPIPTFYFDHPCKLT